MSRITVTPRSASCVALHREKRRAFADTAQRDEAIDLLVNVARADAEDAGASYDLLRRIGSIELGSKVSRAKLQNLIDAERRAGNVGLALTVDRLIMLGVTELADRGEESLVSHRLTCVPCFRHTRIW